MNNDSIDLSFLLKSAIALFLSIVVVYVSVLFLGKDNIVEESIEKIIEEEIGLTVDLTN